MKLKKHGAFLVNYVESFVNKEIDRYLFDLDYSGYMIEHFPEFEREHPRLATRFANTIDLAYDLGQNLSDDRLRDSLADALDSFMGNC